MSSTPRKPLLTAPSLAQRRTSNDNTTTKSLATSSTPASSGQGLARSPSLRQTRPARKITSRSSTSLTADVEEDEEEIRASNAQLITELKEQVEKAEYASEQYRKQLEILQSRLEEFSAEQTAAEEREQQYLSEWDTLRDGLKDSVRQTRELEQSHEAEKNLLLKERDDQARREDGLQSVIQRLNETLRAKELRYSNHAKTGSLYGTQSGGFDSERIEAPEQSGHNIATDANEAILQRDNLIETLRLELAETQIKIAEMEHVGDGRLQEIEKTLLETKMANARLREDNESFQYLLSEKTLKGDFMHDSPSTDSRTGMSSLAEELESAGDEAEGQSEGYKRLEAEVKSLKDGNKALTLYIDKIIGRLLQHEGFEHIIHDKEEAPEAPAKSGPVDKLLPPIPDPQGPSLLQRARSVVSKPGAAKARPISYMPPATTANENPETAPSIPLNRGHRRARSDQAQTDMGAAALVQQMNRSSPLRTVSGGAMSPGIGSLSPHLNPTRGSYSHSTATPSGRTPSGSGPPRDKDRGSGTNSIASEQSGEKDSTDASSAQMSSHGSNNIPGAVMKQNQLRPLRLVKEQAMNEEIEAQKKANRTTWMGWFKGSTLEAQNEGQMR